MNILSWKANRWSATDQDFETTACGANFKHVSFSLCAISMLLTRSILWTSFTLYPFKSYVGYMLFLKLEIHIPVPHLYAQAR